MRVVVDRETCTGHGLCEDLLPEVFEVAPEGIVRILTGACDDGVRPLLEQAVRSCPTRSLSIEAEPGPDQ